MKYEKLMSSNAKSGVQVVEGLSEGYKLFVLADYLQLKLRQHL
jgi:hypothetical protein